MKIIISHDIDHLTVWEHYNDLIIPKHFARSILECGLGHITASEVLGRLKSLLMNRWHNLESLMEFNRENDIPSTFFMATSGGKGLNYTLATAELWVKKLIDSGFDVGVHGICSDNYHEIKAEYDLFKKISGMEKFGIRMHYLNCNEATLNLLSKANYLFDCSNMIMSDPYKVNKLWVFPLHIMDSSIVEKDARWQSLNLEQSIEITKEKIDEVFDAGLNYLTILFHDIYFSDNFRTWKSWYIWLVTYIKENKYEFISYQNAVKELEELKN